MHFFTQCHFNIILNRPSINKTFLEYCFRSSLKPRDKPSQTTSQHKLNCVICGKCQHNNVTEKFRICEDERAKFLLEAATLLQDDVFR